MLAIRSKDNSTHYKKNEIRVDAGIGRRGAILCILKVYVRYYCRNYSLLRREPQKSLPAITTGVISSTKFKCAGILILCK